MRNEKGQMLVQAVVAIGLISIASYFIAQMFVDQHRQIRTIEMKQESIDLRNLLTMTFMSSTSCCPIGNSSIADFDFTEGSTVDVPVKSIFSFCTSSSNPSPPVLVGSSGGTVYKYFNIKNISLINITRPDAVASPNKYLANIKVDIENKDTTGRPLNSLVLPISFLTSTIATEPAASTKRKVTACSNVSGAGGGSSMAGDFTSGAQVYSVPGTYNFTIPANVTRVKVELWGGGTMANVNLSGGFTGASGGYSLDYFQVTPGTSYSVVVGKAGPTNLPTSGNAGDSSFGSLLIAGGATFVAGGTKGGIGSGKWGVNGIDGVTSITSSYYEEGWGNHESCLPVNGTQAPFGSYQWGSGEGTCGGIPREAQPGRAVISW
ncbi:MAG: hypothetical protein ACKOX6_16265 [Bdellovibrio sp.]